MNGGVDSVKATAPESRVRFSVLAIFLKTQWFSARFLQSFSEFQHNSAHFYVMFLRWTFWKISAFQRISCIIFLDPGRKRSRDSIKFSDIHRTSKWPFLSSTIPLLIWLGQPLSKMFSAAFCLMKSVSLLRFIRGGSFGIGGKRGSC